MGQLLLVFFHMIVHRGLIALLVIAVGTREETIFIFLIGDHLGFLI